MSVKVLDDVGVLADCLSGSARVVIVPVNYYGCLEWRGTIQLSRFEPEGIPSVIQTTLGDIAIESVKSNAQGGLECTFTGIGKPSESLLWKLYLDHGVDLR